MTLYRFFSLINTQARMSLKAEASRFVLSYLWWLIEPLLFVLVFYFVFAVLLQTGREDFLLFLICGKIPFIWFSKSVTQASGSLLLNKGLIQQVDVPKSLFPYASVHEALYKQWVVFLMLFAFVGAYGHYPSVTWLWLLPIVIVQYGLILLCSLIGALCVCYVRDVRMLINMGMLFLMFSSGVFWDINMVPSENARHLILTWNPIAFLLDAYRQILMYQSVYDTDHMMVLAIIIGLCLFGVHVLFKRMSLAIAAKVMS